MLAGRVALVSLAKLLGHRLKILHHLGRRPSTVRSVVVPWLVLHLRVIQLLSLRVLKLATDRLVATLARLFSGADEVHPGFFDRNQVLY